MKIKEILDAQTIVISLKANTKSEVLQKLGTKLLEKNYINNLEGFIQDVYAREAEGQTGIGNYVAIPHGKSAYVDKIGVAIGITENEVPWESLDDHGAKVIILFAVGNDTEGAKEHLKILSLFARKIGNDEVIAKLLSAKNAQEVIAAFE